MANFIFDFSTASFDNFKHNNASSQLEPNLYLSTHSPSTEGTSISPTFRTEDIRNNSKESMLISPTEKALQNASTTFTSKNAAFTPTTTSTIKATTTPSFSLGQPLLVWVIIALSVIVGILLLVGVFYICHRRKTSRFFLKTGATTLIVEFVRPFIISILNHKSPITNQLLCPLPFRNSAQSSPDF